MHSARSKCRGFTVPLASAPIVHAVAPAAWWVCPLYEPFDARTRDLLGQDLKPCFGWETERIWKNIHGYSWMIICLCHSCCTTPFLNVFDVFGTCCLGGLMWSALALPLTSTEPKLIHPQNSYQSPWHLTWKFCACQDLLLRWCPKCQHKSCGESWLTIYSRLGHAEIC